MKVHIQLDKPIVNPNSVNDITKNELIKEPSPPPPVPPDVQCVKELRDDIELAIESISIEYANYFGKELNSTEEAKMSNAVYLNRKNDSTRRKEQFLYDFNIAGKYKILR